MRLPFDVVSRIVAATLLASGCYSTRISDGGGTIPPVSTRDVDPADVEVPAGYVVEAAGTGLTYPTAVTFDDAGRVYVVEGGYSYGEDFRTPRLLRLLDNGTFEQIAAGSAPPWTGVEYHDGWFYVAQGGVLEGGAIVRIDANTGDTQTLVAHLPSYGDHHTNGPVIGADGMLYFAIGTATNSGVVGPDNADLGWVHRHPEFHDIPCRDVVLSGRNYRSEDPREGRENHNLYTGAFAPLGVTGYPNQVIEGQLPCTGAVFRMPLEGGDLELVAWGLRNPYGLGFGSDGELYVTENAYDDRGSRPVWGTGDVLWRIEQGTWYGWPDYWAGIPLEKGFEPQGGDAPQLLLAQPPGNVPHPVAKFGVHASANGFDASTSDAFGYSGELFVAQFGDLAPVVGKVWSPVGFDVVRVDAATGNVHQFAGNAGDQLGPASYLQRGGFERPNDAEFDPTGETLYVVDFGVLTTRADYHPVPKTGVLWRIRRGGETG